MCGIRRNARNRAIRSAVKTQIKKLRTALVAKDVAAADKEFRVAVKKLDQAAAKGTIHKNTASRLKSRLSRAILKVKKPAA